MHRHLPILLVLVLSGCLAQTADRVSDQEFAARALAQAKIGQSLAEAETNLKSLGLACFPVVIRPIPGVPQSQLGQSELSCSRPAPPQHDCRQEISLLANNGKVVSVKLSFEQLPDSQDGTSCGR